MMAGLSGVRRKAAERAYSIIKPPDTMIAGVDRTATPIRTCMPTHERLGAFEYIGYSDSLGIIRKITVAVKADSSTVAPKDQRRPRTNLARHISATIARNVLITLYISI
jgi:hypothetical protein